MVYLYLYRSAGQVTLAIMERHLFRSPARLIRSTVFQPSPRYCSSESMNFIRCRPLALLPSTRPSKQHFSSPSDLRMCPKNLSCLLRTVFMRDLSMSALFKTASLVSRAVHGILYILRKNHISAASNLSIVFFLRVQHSQPYNKVDHIWLFNILNLK